MPRKLSLSSVESSSASDEPATNPPDAEPAQDHRCTKEDRQLRPLQRESGGCEDFMNIPRSGRDCREGDCGQVHDSDVRIVFLDLHVGDREAVLENRNGFVDQ